MVRIAAPLLLVVAALVPDGPAAAQVWEEEHDWTVDRPDAHAPAGIENDITVDAGRYQLAYRYVYVSNDQILTGESVVTPEEVLAQGFLSTPFAGNQKRHELGVVYGLTDRISLSARGVYLQIEQENITDTQFFLTESEGFGDVEAGALFRFLDEGPYRAHAHLDVSIPTGSTDKTAGTPLTTPASRPVGFGMQTGSGTWDLEPGVTLLVQNRVASVGGQVSGVIRLEDENDEGYSLGNRLLLRAWGGYRLTERVAFEVGLDYQAWDPVEGFDLRADPTADPTFNPRLQGGSRLEVPFGFNFWFPDGALAGHRLLVQASLPVSEDLDGPQLSRDWSLTLGWEKTY